MIQNVCDACKKTVEPSDDETKVEDVVVVHGMEIGVAIQFGSDDLCDHCKAKALRIAARQIDPAVEKRWQTKSKKATGEKD